MSSPELTDEAVIYLQQAKLAALGVLSSGVSHDVKNPLNNIRGAIGMLKLNKKHKVYDQLSKEDLEKEVFEALEVIENNVIRANDIIDWLSAFSQRAKQMPVVSVDLNGCLLRAQSLVKGSWAVKELEISNRLVEEELPILVQPAIFEDALFVFLFLLSNSIQGRGAFGFKTFLDDEDVVLEVKDLDQILLDDVVQHIWMPFLGSDNLPERNDFTQQDLGLDFFVVKQAVKRFNGKLTITYEKNQPAVFRIALPKSAAEKT